MSDESKPQCNAEVHRREEYRMVRGHGFRMNYSRGRCARRAVEGDLCRQHAKMERSGEKIWRYAKSPASPAPAPAHIREDTRG